jgi:6-pyruvoyl-tetrahydropterin synthase
MIIDFKDVKDALNKILPDHQYLNDFIPEIKIPTAENLAPALFSHLKILLPGLVSLTLWESDNAGCRYVES